MVPSSCPGVSEQEARVMPKVCESMTPCVHRCINTYIQTYTSYIFLSLVVWTKRDEMRDSNSDYNGIVCVSVCVYK